MKTKTFNPKTARFFTFNNEGTRGVRIDSNGNRETLPVSLDGVTVKNKSVFYWEQCGNFSFPVVRVKGKTVSVYPDSEVEPTKWMPFDVKYPTDLEANFAKPYPIAKI